MVKKFENGGVSPLSSFISYCYIGIKYYLYLYTIHY